MTHLYQETYKSPTFSLLDDRVTQLQDIRLIKWREYRYLSDYRSRDREFYPGPAPYFNGDWSCNNFYGHSPPFCWFKKGCCQLCTKKLVKRLVKLTQDKSVVRWTDRPYMTIAVDWEVKNQTKQKPTNQTFYLRPLLVQKLNSVRL